MVRRGRRRSSSGIGLRLMLALGIALFSVISYFGTRTTNPVTGEVQYVDLTPDQEIAMGLQAAPQMAAQHGGLHPRPRSASFSRPGRRRNRAVFGRQPNAVPVRVSPVSRRATRQRLCTTGWANFYHGGADEPSRLGRSVGGHPRPRSRACRRAAQRGTSGQTKAHPGFGGRGRRGFRRGRGANGGGGGTNGQYALRARR